MDLYLLKEVWLFSLSILYGVIILLFYDCFRVIRRLIPHSSVMIAIQDLFFWIVTGFSIFALLYRYNNGSIRGYCILGMGLGMLFYSIAISPFFVKINVAIGNFIKKHLRKYKKDFIMIYKKKNRSRRRRSHTFFYKVKKFLYGK